MSLDPAALAVLQGVDDRRLPSCLDAVRKLRAGGFAWRARAKVRILRNFTVEPLAAPLELAGYRRGLAIDVTLGAFDTYAQEILAPAEAGASPPDLVLLSLWLEDLPLAFEPSGAIAAERVIEHVTSLTERLLESGAGRVALTTFVPPQRRALSPADDLALARIDLALRELEARHPRLVLVDLRKLVERLGEAAALDRRGALMHRAPLKHELCVLLGESLARAVASLHGARRKVLALDCDGTLWGGVVGEDGPAGIRLGPDDYPGRAYLAFQEQVLSLQRAGVLVVLVSKNEEADVMAVLGSHPHCRLRPEHVAAHRIGWAPKPDGLRALAEELNVGLDSFVFIDDSPYECALVREALPMVDVRRVPEQAADLPSLLRDAAADFGVETVTAEDLARTRSIRAERQRADAARGVTDLEAFLASLELKAEIGPPDAAGVVRLAQLTQKTNQFNLTTRRHGPELIERLARSDDAVVLALRAEDRFGDYGIVGAAIALHEGGEVRIDTLLLSCRALGRRLEDALVAELLGEARRRWGDLPVRAEWLATPKNEQVRGFWEARGFCCVEEAPSRKAYLMQAGAPVEPAPAFIAVQRRA